MTPSAPNPVSTAISALVFLSLAGCGPAADVDDITPGGPSSLSPALDPTYEGRTLDGWGSALASKDAAERYVALLALAEFHDEAAAYRVAIEARLADPSASVRWAALETLGRMGEGASASASPVVARLDDEEEGVRRAAARAAVRLGLPAVEPLRTRLTGDDPVQAEVAADVLVLMGAPATEALSAAALDERPLTAVTAIVALGRLGTVAGPAGVAALEQASARKGDVRTTALDALAALGESGVGALRRLAASPDPDLAEAAKSRIR